MRTPPLASTHCPAAQPSPAQHCSDTEQRWPGGPQPVRVIVRGQGDLDRSESSHLQQGHCDVTSKSNELNVVAAISLSAVRR